MKQPILFFSKFVYFLGTNKLTVHIFADHPGQSGEKEEPQTGKSRAKKGPGKTVSTFYRSFIFRKYLFSSLAFKKCANQRFVPSIESMEVFLSQI